MRRTSLPIVLFLVLGLVASLPLSYAIDVDEDQPTPPPPKSLWALVKENDKLKEFVAAATKVYEAEPTATPGKTLLKILDDATSAKINIIAFVDGGCPSSEQNGASVPLLLSHVIDSDASAAGQLIPSHANIYQKVVSIDADGKGTLSTTFRRRGLPSSHG
jgi:hypothetical protein